MSFKMNFLVIFSCLLVLAKGNEEIAFPDFNLKSHFQEELSTNRVDLDPVSLDFAVQRLDNFDFRNPYNRMWPQRFYKNSEHYVEGGPIFIFLGGNWGISPLVLQMGLFYDIAVENKAVMYYPEQRFYGLSHPTSNTSVDNLKYFTVEQTLSDYLHFIKYIKSNNSNLAEAKVILAGTAISATYAVWLRQKYPSLVTGVWASSAPLEVKTEFPEFKELIGHAIRKVGGDACYDRIANAFDIMEDLISKGETERIEKEFKTCGSINTKDQRDVSMFFSTMANYMTIAAEVNGPGFNIDSTCQFMTNQKFEDELAAYSALIRSLIQVNCFEFRYKKVVEFLRNVTWISSDRQWLYQECNEFSWLPVGDSKNQPFGQRLTGDFYYRLCSDVFDGRFSPERVKGNAKRMNDLYGGLEPKVTNVYFTHGDLDPIRIVGIQRDYNEKSPGVVIPGYGISCDLNSALATDSLELDISKERVKELIKQWLKE